MKAINIDFSSLINNGNFPSAGDYFFYNGLKDGKIYIDMDIGDDTVQFVIYPLMQMNEDDSIEQIDVYINSLGGDPYIAMAVVNVLEHLTKPCTIHILGVAASAAGFIAMAKSKFIKTVCSPYSVGLIHPGSIYLEGNGAEVRDTHDFLQKYDDVIIKNFILARTNISEEKYESINRREFWMTADEMLEFGIVDKIV